MVDWVSFQKQEAQAWSWFGQHNSVTCYLLSSASQIQSGPDPTQTPRQNQLSLPQDIQSLGQRPGCKDKLRTLRKAQLAGSRAVCRNWLCVFQHSDHKGPLLPSQCSLCENGHRCSKGSVQRVSSPVSEIQTLAPWGLITASHAPLSAEFYLKGFLILQGCEGIFQSLSPLSIIFRFLCARTCTPTD